MPPPAGTGARRTRAGPLNDYIHPFGGGYFALPGVTSKDDWYGRDLLA